MAAYLDFSGLTHFVNKCKELFATTETVTSFKNDTDLYVINVDYTQIEFDKTQSYKELL